MKLKNPAVLITGGTRRLGLACAHEVLDLGFDVILHYRSRAREARAVLTRHPLLRERVRLVQQDLTPASSPDLIEKCRGMARRLIGLVNSASVFEKGDLNDVAHLSATLDTNALVPSALTAAFALQAGAGWVVHLTDAHIDGLNRTYQNYRVSKLLLTELTRQHAFLYAPGIRVNAIAPGAVLPASGTSRKEFAALGSHIPLGHTGSPADIRRALAYLIQGDYVTGQVLCVDGGWHLCR